MMGSESNPSPPISTLTHPPLQISPSITLQRPLTRRGHGPGLILIVDHYANVEKKAGCVDPPPMQKWAEEGFAVVMLKVPGKEEDGGEFPLERAVEVLRGCGECDFGDGVGIVSYLTRIPFTIEETLCLSPHIKCLVSYSGKRLTSLAHSLSPPPPQLLHHAGPLLPRRQSFAITPEPQSSQMSESSRLAPAGKVKEYRYVDAKKESKWVLPSEEDYDGVAAGLAHGRSVGFLKGELGGPWFDVEAVWEEHCAFEFGSRDVEGTMGTMVEEPYVNHVPTMTGGIGQTPLSHFYTHSFIHSNPPSTRLTLLSRTISPTSLIDEFILSLTHTCPIPWLLPNIPPTNLPLSIPMTSNIVLRGDRLAREHIWWDQAGVLRQLGLVGEWVGWPYKVGSADGEKGEGRGPGEGKRFEVRLPVVGKEAAEKLVDEGCLDSNGLMEGAGVREMDDV